MGGWCTSLRRTSSKSCANPGYKYSMQKYDSPTRVSTSEVRVGDPLAGFFGRVHEATFRGT